MDENRFIIINDKVVDCWYYRFTEKIIAVTCLELFSKAEVTAFSFILSQNYLNLKFNLLHKMTNLTKLYKKNNKKKMIDIKSSLSSHLFC